MLVISFWGGQVICNAVIQHKIKVMVLIKSDFETKLGIVSTYIESNHSECNFTDNEFSIKTSGHQISLEIFELKNEWLPKHMQFEASTGWRWFISKINNQKEKLTINCELTNPTNSLKYYPDSGECLDAIKIENQINELHIGTEDTDAHMARSKNNDWMPKRFEKLLGLNKQNGLNFTKYIPFGFETKVPELLLNEQIYFHYLVATNTKNEIVNYSNEVDVSTWFAVEQSKNKLDKYLEK